MPPRKQQTVLLDTELAHLAPEMRWREWMGRVEAVIFASATPVDRQTLARVVGRNCNVDLLIDDIGAELRGRPYELVAVAGGWHFRTRNGFADAIRASGQTTGGGAELSHHEATVLMAIACFQPVTRSDLSKVFGKEISRDTISALRQAELIGSGPRSPTPGAPYTYVTTKRFLSVYGLETLRDLPDLEMLEDAGLLSRARLPESGMPGETDDEDAEETAADEENV